MSTYTPPTASGIIYNFLAGGYTPPTASGMDFPFLYQPSYSATSDLQAAIDVYNYQTTTYSYVKKRNIQVLGYRQNGIQILKGRIEYGGIRDLGATLYRQPTHVNLPAYIYATSNFLNLGGFIRTTIQSSKDLGAQAGGHLPEDLGGYIRPTVQDYKDLGGFTRPTIQSYSDLLAAIRRLDHGSTDLGSSAGGHLPTDLQGIINIIEIRDLPAYLNGEFYKGQADLGGWVTRIFERGYKDLGVYIRSLMIEFDLPASLNIIEVSNLPAFVRSFYRSTKNLAAIMNFIEFRNLQGIIHGYAIYDLPASVAGVYGPYDLQAYIRVHPHLNLPGQIHGWYSGFKDLQGIVESYYRCDLQAFIGTILPFDLGAEITARGEARDLLAYLYPRTILLKKAVLIPLLEHKDLGGLINFMCFGSGMKNLSAYIYTLYKLDLNATVIGWYGGTADNIKDLRAYINCGAFYAFNTVLATYIPEVYKYTLAKLRFAAYDPTPYKVVDTVALGFSTFYFKNLIASIHGLATSFDLGASIEGVFDFNYTELPENIRPRTQEIVINIYRAYEQSRRFVELMFDNTGIKPYEYFYVSGNQTIYKVDRSRAWTVMVTSYLETEEFIDRVDVRRKFLFKLSNYNTMDEAIRDLINRVTDYSKSDLGAYIFSVAAIPPNHVDLAATVMIKHYDSWIKYLGATITGV